MSQDSHETEIKLPAADVAAARRMLYRAGFRADNAEFSQDNTVFDTSRLKLRKSATLLRLREAGGKAIVTFKGRPVAAKHKSREELGGRSLRRLDVPARDCGAALSDRAVFRYQKQRTEFKQAGGAGVATLDETPIGVYLELQGQPGWIDRTARQLGYRENDYIVSSYGRLYSLLVQEEPHQAH